MISRICWLACTPMQNTNISITPGPRKQRTPSKFAIWNFPKWGMKESTSTNRIWWNWLRCAGRTKRGLKRLENSWSPSLFGKKMKNEWSQFYSLFHSNKNLWFILLAVERHKESFVKNKRITFILCAQATWREICVARVSGFLRLVFYNFYESLIKIREKTLEEKSGKTLEEKGTLLICISINQR